MSGTDWTPDPDDLPGVGPRAAAVIDSARTRLETMSVCSHLTAGREGLRVWDSTWQDRLVCETCFSAVLERSAASDRRCSSCGRPAGENAAEFTGRLTDNVGMHFWMCEPCIRVDFPAGLPGSPRLRDWGEPASTPARLWMSDEKVASVLADDEIPADTRVLLLLPMLWLNLRSGLPANMCVQSCLTLRHAYGQLGVRAEVRAVELVAREPSGRQIRVSGPEPSWRGAHFAGHCVLWLPETGRLIDPTVQKLDVPLVRDGPPVMGRLGLTGGLPAGDCVTIRRNDLTLVYTVLSGRYTALIVNGRPIARYSEEIRREGVNLASLAVIGLRMFDRVQEAPFPRLRSLLGAIGGAPESFVDGNWRFDVDGPEESPQLLDELPLAAGTPPNPAEEDPSAITPSS